jgi:hypothetical protein
MTFITDCVKETVIDDAGSDANGDAVTDADEATFQRSNRPFRRPVSKSDNSTNCPSDSSGYETTYPIFGGQTEYGQHGIHVEPFYRYRVYSESKV